MIRDCFSSGLWVVPCRSHALCRKSCPFPSAIPPDATPVAAEAKILCAFAVRVVIHVAAAEPAVWLAPVLNLVARCRASSDNSDALPEQCGCCCYCCRAAADAHMANSTAAAPAGCSPAAAAAAYPAD